MTETTETAETTAPMPALLESLNRHLVQLAVHAANHGHESAGEGVKITEGPMPECLAEQISELTISLFTMAGPQNENASIILPRDLPDGLVEQLQDVARAEVARMEAGQ